MSKKDKDEKDYITYQFRIYPTEAQANHLQQHFGCVRFVYNHFLYLTRNEYAEKGEHRSYKQNAADLTELKKHPDYLWLKEVHSQPLQQALKDLAVAYKRFFAKLSGKPHFKRKQHEQAVRYPQGVQLNTEKEQTYLPKIGWVKTVFHRDLPDTALKSVTVKQMPSGRLFIKCLFEREPQPVTYAGGVIGIDVGLTHFATTSDDVKVENPRHLHQSMKRLKHLQRNLSRKQYGSKGWQKARQRLAKLHEKIRNQRADFLHRLTYKWTNENQVIRLETLNIQGMLKNHKLAQAISSVAWSELKRQLTYKSKWYGCHIEQVPMFFASTQLCHNCHQRNASLTLADRKWQCPTCGATHDRDLNAARNIRDYESYLTAGAAGNHAGGGGKVHRLSDGSGASDEARSYHLLGGM